MSQKIECVQGLPENDGEVKPKRKSLSKKSRFEVFKRDGFQCQYCGQVPPACVLEVDHIDPVSKGGGDEIENLVTSCFDCNRGKSDRAISAAPPSFAEMTASLKEKEAQLKAYRRMRDSINKRKSEQVSAVNTIFSYYFSGHALPIKERTTIMVNFVDVMDPEALEEAMARACVKFQYSPDDALRYFFGTCWRTLRKDYRR